MMDQVKHTNRQPVTKYKDVNTGKEGDETYIERRSGFVTLNRTRTQVRRSNPRIKYIDSDLGD